LAPQNSPFTFNIVLILLDFLRAFVSYAASYMRLTQGRIAMTERLMRRGGFWHYTRRVPKQYAELDRRVIVQESTGIRVADDPRAIRAAPAARRLDKELEQHWRRLASGADAQ
jgi:hypothetical protein